MQQVRRISKFLRGLADDEERQGDLDAAEMLLHLSHQVRDVADNAEERGRVPVIVLAC